MSVIEMPTLLSASLLADAMQVVVYTLPLLAVFLLYLWISKWLVRKLDAALSKLNAIGASILRRKDDPRGPAAAAPGAKRVDWHESILLPNQTEPIKRVGMDIGGSLAKLVYFQPNPPTTSLAESQEVVAGEDGELKERVMGGKLRFIKFETRKLDELIEFMKQQNLVQQSIHVTGGGAHSTSLVSKMRPWSPDLTRLPPNTVQFPFIHTEYAKLFEERLGVHFEKEDEMHTAITGLNFLLLNIPECVQRPISIRVHSLTYPRKNCCAPCSESFTFSPDPAHPNPREFVSHLENPFPYLLVNIGSGVSMLRVDSEDSYQRVNGTAVGGGTFWGLCHLLTGVSDFDEMLELSKQGRADRIDLLVGDIYGQDYTKVGLPATTTASSFGKVLYKDKKLSASDLRPEDIAISLLRMISNNIGQIAYLTALQHGLKRIYFGGFFIRNHPDTMTKMSFAINYWSKGRMKAHFLTHEGYLGAMGALIAENRSLYERSREWLEMKKKELSQYVSKFPFNVSLHPTSPKLSTDPLKASPPQETSATSPRSSSSISSSSSGKNESRRLNGHKQD